MVLQHSFHPGAALVVGKEDRDHLGGLDQEHHCVEEVRQKGRGPVGLHLAHEVVLATVSIAGNLNEQGKKEDIIIMEDFFLVMVEAKFSQTQTSSDLQAQEKTTTTGNIYLVGFGLSEEFSHLLQRLRTYDVIANK